MLHEAGSTPKFVYFPNDSMVSLVGMTGERRKVEVGLVGNEGVVGISLALGPRPSPVTALVQGSGSAMRMTSAQFLRELARSPAFSREVSRCAYMAMAMAMQIATCNSAHLLQARLARWLLMTRDRVFKSRFELTQEFLAQMLGTRRATVSVAAAALQGRRLITYRRGWITIVDAEGLRSAACSCYETMRKLSAR